MWPKHQAIYYLECLTIAILVLLSRALQHGSFDTSVWINLQSGITIVGSCCAWFANRLVLEYLLQSRINNNKVTKTLPLVLTVASLGITAAVYLVFYSIFVLSNLIVFDVAKLLQGLFISCGLSLLFVAFYAISQIWQSWWSDGASLFKQPEKQPIQNTISNSILLKTSKETIQFNLKDIGYFISESKIVFLVDTTGKKWLTQYNLGELEDQLSGGFFRINRKILVSRQVISQIKKLPNHRLLVTIGADQQNATQTISRYKSTKFKQWLEHKTSQDLTIR